MSNPVSTKDFIPFVASRYPRYEFDDETRSIRDTKFHRDLVAGCRRGGKPYYRLVADDGAVTHVLAEAVFGPEANEDVEVLSDFEPSDFASRYDFEFDPPAVKRRPGKGPKSGDYMTLRAPNGWEHWTLTRDDGVRVHVTPAELRQAGQRTEWEVAKPRGSRVFPHLFPQFAFTRDGKVYRIKSDKPLIRPVAVPLDKTPEPGCPNPDEQAIYRLRSLTGTWHRFTRASIKSLFNVLRARKPSKS